MEYKKYLLSEICDYKTGRLNSNAAVDNGKYKFFTCAPKPLTIDSYSYDDNVIVLAGNNANGIFHINRFNGKFDAYQRTYIIKPKADVIDIDYLYYFLKFKLNFLQSQSIGSATKYLTKPILDNLEVYCPEKKMKQKAISSILKFLDKKLELNKKIIANLEELSQTLFKRWFVDFEFPDENGNPYKSNGGEMIDSELGMVPKGWNFEKLKLLIENIKDNIRTKSLSQEDRYVPIDLIPKRKLTFYDYKSSNEAKSSLIKFKKNDILLGSMRVYFHRVSLAPFDGKTRNTVFTLRPRDERYLYYLLNAINKDDFIQYAANNSKGSTMPYAVWDGILDEVTVLNPPLQYLIEFNSIVQKYFDISIILLKQNRQLEDLRDTLLPKLMSGELEIPDDI